MKTPEARLQHGLTFDSNAKMQRNSLRFLDWTETRTHCINNGWELCERANKRVLEIYCIIISTSNVGVFKGIFLIHSTCEIVRADIKTTTSDDDEDENARHRAESEKRKTIACRWMTLTMMMPNDTQQRSEAYQSWWAASRYIFYVTIFGLHWHRRCHSQRTFLVSDDECECRIVKPMTTYMNCMRPYTNTAPGEIELSWVEVKSGMLEK